MDRMGKLHRAGRAAATLFVAAGLGGCIDWEWRDAGAERIALTAEDLAGVSEVDIRVQRGSVAVEGDPQRGDATVDVQYLGRVWSGKGKCGKKGHGGYDEDDLDKVREDAGVTLQRVQGTLVIAADAADDARTDLFVRLPADLDVHVHVRRGDATVDGVTGDVTYGGVAGIDFTGDDVRPAD